MTRDKISNEAIIKVLNKQGGLLKQSAKKIGIARSTLYLWIYGRKSKDESKVLEPDEELIQAVKDAREDMIDYAEGALKKKIKEGDNTSIIFYLKTQGKDRGYVERQEYAEHKEQELFPEDEHDEDGTFIEDN